MKSSAYRWFEGTTLGLPLLGMLLTFAFADLNNAVLHILTVILLLGGFIGLSGMSFVALADMDRQE